MTGARINVWTTKTCIESSKTMLSPMHLLNSEAFVKRAHFQCAIWRRALEDPPNLDPTVYGWFKNVETKSLQPVMLLPSRLSAAPDLFAARAPQKDLVIQVDVAVWQPTYS